MSPHVPAGRDFALAARVARTCLLQVRELPFVLVMPKKHPLAKLKRIPFKRLQNVPLHALGNANFPDYAPRMKRMLRPFGVKPNFEIQTANTVSILLA